MKPFNLEEAKAGKKVVTKYGTKVSRFLCFDRKGWDTPIVALVEEADGREAIHTFSKLGRKDGSEVLFMVPETVTMYKFYYRDKHFPDLTRCHCSSDEAEVVRSRNSRLGENKYLYDVISEIITETIEV